MTNSRAMHLSSDLEKVLECVSPALRRTKQGVPLRWMLYMQVSALDGDDAASVSLSGAGLTVRSKPSPTLEAQDREPMYTAAAYSEGVPRHVL